MNEEMTRCVESCLSCYKTCQSTAMQGMCGNLRRVRNGLEANRQHG